MAVFTVWVVKWRKLVCRVEKCRGDCLSWVYFWILDAFLPSGQGDTVYLYNKFPSCVLLLLKWLSIPSKQDWNNTEMGFSCLQNPFTFTYEKESLQMNVSSAVWLRFSLGILISISLTLWLDWKAWSQMKIGIAGLPEGDLCLGIKWNDFCLLW